MDKPLDWSSFDVVKYVRNRIPAKKVGHAGTLDPLATGLLVLCSGKATKTISEIQSNRKTYVADIKFGASTPSYDSETEPDQYAEWDHITENKLREIAESDFRGKIEQVPPAYSAIRVGGERLYKKVRRGEQVEPKPRIVEIHNIEILNFSLPEVKIRVICGKGTYIRSLAFDIGLALGSRAHLSALRRTEITPYNVNEAFTPEEFNDWVRKTG